MRIWWRIYQNVCDLFQVLIFPIFNELEFKIMSSNCHAWLARIFDMIRICDESNGCIHQHYTFVVCEQRSSRFSKFLRNFFIKMTIFQTIQTNFAILDITAHQSIQPYPFNSTKIVMAFLMFGLSTILHFVYIFHVADSFEEYIECITTTSGICVVSLFLTSVVLKMTTLFEYFDKVDEIISMSEYKMNIFILYT